MKTSMPKIKDIERKHHLIDAKGKVLGRLATEIATLLRGKHKVNFTPNFDMGDFVTIVNAQDIKITGDKKKKKIYFRHSGYPGGLKSETLERLLERDPREVIKRATYGMLPDNKLRKKQLRRLKIYKGDKEIPNI